MLFFLKKIIKKQTNPYFSGDPVVKTFKMVHIKKKRKESLKLNPGQVNNS